MSDEIDPEVLADLRLRASSQHDRTRTGAGTWSPPKIVDRVPCRNRCGAVVAWTAEAEDTFQTFNRQLAARADAPLDKTRIMFCARCEAEGRAQRATGLRGLHAKVAEAIRELKNGCEPDRERELLAKLSKAGHPDVKGLEQWLREKAAKSSRRVTRGSL